MGRPDLAYLTHAQTEPENTSISKLCVVNGLTIDLEVIRSALTIPVSVWYAIDMKIGLKLLVTVITLNAPPTHAQRAPQVTEIRIRGVNCTNGHPLRNQEYHLWLFERRKAPQSERLRFVGSADGRGILSFTFRNPPSYLEAELFMSSNDGLPSPELETKVVLEKGLVVDWCNQRVKKRVAISPSPGEITFYDSPAPFWMKLIPKIWE